jgi:glycosyltransferase involved in cell wall biosynthesis
VTHHATLAWFEPFRTKLSDFTFWFSARPRAWCLPGGAGRMVAHGVSRGRRPSSRSASTRKFDQGAPEPRSAESAFRLFFVARLIEGKGHRELLQAVARLSHLHETLRVVILGDGAERPSIENDVRRLGLGALVDVVGHVANEKVPALMRTASAISAELHARRTFPLSLIEGMAMSLPTVGSRWLASGYRRPRRNGSSSNRDVAGPHNDRTLVTSRLARQMGQNGYDRAMALHVRRRRGVVRRIYKESAI